MTMFIHLLTRLLWASMLNLAYAKTIWMNQVSGYSSLPPCAITPVSVIVRDMSYGCGDNNAVTSQDCFCTASSSHFSSLISKAVAGQCSEGVQENNAVGVFNRYCDQVRNASSQVTQTAGEFVTLRKLLTGCDADIRKPPTAQLQTQAALQGPPAQGRHLCHCQRHRRRRRLHRVTLARPQSHSRSRTCFLV